jgi:hypothetical protein
MMDVLYDIVKNDYPYATVHSLLDESGLLKAKILCFDCMMVLFNTNSIIEITKNLHFDTLTVKIDFENKKISIKKYGFVSNVTTNDEFNSNVDINNYSTKLLNIITFVNNFMIPNITDF